MIKHKQQQKIPSCSESGFTIIESLVAIIVVAILLAAIAPVIVISTATRVQSRRVELATSAAKTYIDGIRTGAITTLPTLSNLTTVATATASAPRSLSGQSAIAATATTPAIAAIPAAPNDYLIVNSDGTTKMPVPSSATGLYCFTITGTITTTDCTNKSREYYIQAARIADTATSNSYRLAIRVYRADIDFTKTITTNTGNSIDNKKTQNTFTGGLGNPQAPLVEMTTDISSANLNSPTSFQTLCQRLGVATNKDCQ